MSSVLDRIDHHLGGDEGEIRSPPWLRLAMAVTALLLFLGAVDLGEGVPVHVAAYVATVLLLGGMVAQVLLRIRRAASWRAWIRSNPLRTAWLGLQLVGMATVAVGAVAAPPIIGLLVILELVGRSFATATTGGVSHRNPTLLVIGSFVVLIAGGAAALHAPGMTPSGAGLPPGQALFTACSAVCVTGLSVIDVGSRLSLEGQVILLVLIQLGGLGLMTLGAFVLVFLDKTHRSRGSAVIASVLGGSGPSEGIRLASLIVLMSLVIEGIGALALLPVFEDPWTATFCSVSAFCNAGFFLGPTSLEAHHDDVLLNVVVMLLITLGGLGFPVLLELGRRGLQRMRAHAGGTAQRLTVQTRLVLLVSAFLVVGGAVAFFLLERERSLAHLPPGEQVMASFFQSVTMRTAGFDTVPFATEGVGAMRPATLVLTTGMMSVGASPLGTGGGLKTLTFVVLVLGVGAVLFGRDDIVVFRRRVARSALLKAGAVFTLYTTTYFALVLGLLLADGSRHGLVDVLFEAASALGTVGLSTGITGDLSGIEQVLLCSAMLMGRVGPLTFFLLFSVTHSGQVSYPEEDVVVG